MRLLPTSSAVRSRSATIPTAQLWLKLVHASAMQANTRQYVVCDDRLEDVELELTLGAGHGHGRVVADDLHAHHRERLALGGVDLARHDRAARLVGWQIQLADPVRGPLASRRMLLAMWKRLDGQRLERARRLHHGIVCAQRFELVRRGHERMPGELCDDRGHAVGVSRGRVQPGPHGGAAQRELGEMLE